jgi:Tol biopolymer transport system component
MAKILEHDPPPMMSLQPMTPPALDRVVNRCLAKDPDDRWQTARDLGVELTWIAEGGGQIRPRPLAPAQGVRALGRRALLLSLGMLLLGAGFAGVAIWNLKPAPPQSVSRFVIALPVDQQFAGGFATRRVIALSPQGTHLAYAANTRLYLRAIDQLNAVPIQGTETAGGSADPFFSADGQWIGFWQANELRKVALTGGAPVKLSELPAGSWGASWGADDTIVYGRGSAGIWRVSGQGGTAERLVAVDEKKELAHGPQLLPGARAVLFTLAAIGGTWNEAQIVVQSLDTGERKVVLRGGRDARYVETGHLVYARAGILLAVPFDLSRLEVTGGPVPLVEGVRDAGATTGTGATHFSLSASGSLLYVPGGPDQEAERRLVWVSRNGAEQPLGAPARPYGQPRLSPDERRVAVEIGEPTTQIWVYDLVRETLTRVTFEGTTNSNPTWTPDGKRLAFQSNKDGLPAIFWQLADGSGGLERLTSGGEGTHNPGSWSADGQLLAFHEVNPKTRQDIWVFRLSDRKAEPFLRTPFPEGGPIFSPDGRWLAYVANESGRFEIYVQPYPGPGGKWQISTEGGTERVWSRTGRELFYRSGNKMMAVDITTQPTFSAGRPRMLFEGQYLANQFPFLPDYDVSADGQRFLMLKQGEAASQSAAQINVVLNWFEELKRRVPTK